MNELPSLEKKSSDKPKYIMLGILGLVLVWRGVAMFSSPNDAAASSNGNKVAVAQAGIDNGEYTQKLPTIDINWKFKLPRDPFDSTHIVPKAAIKPEVTNIPDNPVIGKEEEFKKLQEVIKTRIKLGGTFLGAHPRAIINGKLYNVNDVIDENIRLTSIGSGHIILEMEGFKFQVNMKY